MRYLLLFSSIGISLIGQFTLKKGILQSSLSPSLISIIQTLFSPLVMMGISLYVVSMILWLFVLQRFPLSVAYPVGALGYVIIVIVSSVFFNEAITVQKIIAVGCIIFGVVLLSVQK